MPQAVHDRGGSAIHSAPSRLELLQASDPTGQAIRRVLKSSGPRKSTMLIVAIYGVCLTVGAAIAAVVAHSVSPALAISCAASVVVALSTTGRFRTRMVPDFVGQITRIGGSVAAGAAIPFLAVALFEPSRTNFRAFAGLVLVLLVASLLADWTSAWAIRKLWARGRLRSRAVMIGSGRLAREMAVELRLRPEYGVDLVDVVVPGLQQDLAEEVVGCIAESSADRLVVAPLYGEAVDKHELLSTIRRVLGMGVPTFIVPRFYEIGLGLDSMSPDRARGYPLVRVQRSAHPTLGMALKRAIDLVVSATILVLFAPLMAVVAAAVGFTSKGPIFFRQPRIGQAGDEFEMLKFRSMYQAEDQHSERSSGHRVTPVGRVLRATSLDELPQLLNVFRGEMSLVGPRPERTSFVEEGLELYPGYAERHRQPMGLTGLAQVAGLRGEDTSVAERVKFDNLYIDQWSMSLDLQIMAKTLFAIILQTRYRSREGQLEAAISSLPDDASVRTVIDLTRREG